MSRHAHGVSYTVACDSSGATSWTVMIALTKSHQHCAAELAMRPGGPVDRLFHINRLGSRVEVESVAKRHHVTEAQHS